MWSRRSQLEISMIERNHKVERFSPIFPLVLSIVVTPVIMIVLTVFGTRYVKPFERLDQIFFDSGLMCLIIFSLVYLLQITGNRSLLSESSDLFCEDCQKHFDEDVKRCRCGRKLEPIEFFKKINT